MVDHCGSGSKERWDGLGVPIDVECMLVLDDRGLAPAAPSACRSSVQVKYSDGGVGTRVNPVSYGSKNDDDDNGFSRSGGARVTSPSAPE